MIQMQNLVDRFLKYVSFDTQSERGVEAFPSTEKQKELAKYLVEEMKSLGIEDAHMDENGYVLGTIWGNVADEKEKGIKTFGYIAHMDTATEVSGKDVKPRIIENYDGSDIVINEGMGLIMKPEDFPILKERIGHDLIVTDGTTLLGGDNKAGVAEIMTMAEYLLSHPEIKHGTIKIGFTPDEEVGRGAEFFDVEKFGAEFAYTVDGGDLGQINYENFNAASAEVTVHGKVIHLGMAKGKMVSAARVAVEFCSMLDPLQVPENTSDYEGFIHVDEIEGHTETAKLRLVIREHDKEKFRQKKDSLLRITAYLNEKYGENTVEMTIQDSYLNMREMILPHMDILETAKKAMEQVGVTPSVEPVRGGTDGARLSYMGLPCPNLGQGTHNAHGRFEFVSIQEMEKTAEILVKIAELYAK